jgi:hypothetical protein
MVISIIKVNERWIYLLYQQLSRIAKICAENASNTGAEANSGRQERVLVIDNSVNCGMRLIRKPALNINDGTHPFHK